MTIKRKKNITVTVDDTKATIIKQDLVYKFIDVKDYAAKNGLLNNSNKNESVVKALNSIDEVYGIVDIYGLGELIVARIRGEL